MSNVLITGTSSGFGRVTTEVLARAGHRVWATMRGVDGRNAAAAAEIRALAGAEGLAVTVLEMDVRDDASVERAVARAEAESGGLDVVVNNAGAITLGVSEAFTSEQVHALFDTNVVGVHRVNRAALPAMRARGAGLVVYVSSVVGRTVAPFMGLYAGTKHALEAVAESYHYETVGQGIDTTILQPGAFATPGLLHGAVVPADGERAATYGPLVGGAVEALAQGLAGRATDAATPSPSAIGEAILRLVETPAGERPLRLPIGVGTEGPAAINAVAARVQAERIAGMGMTALVSRPRVAAGV
jgi:NAD(P)-dependent dehydrogenase (short-subunit alcohol dehydrogenase family)